MQTKPPNDPDTGAWGGMPADGTLPAESGPDGLRALCWHIERYDRLRASTASRAAVVLSAGAILSAGNAIVITQVLSGAFDGFDYWLVVLFTTGVMASAALVVRSVLKAANVLVTPRPSERMFAFDGSLPPSLLFNGTYTASVAETYETFRAALTVQKEVDRIEAARVELYVGIRQHRHRYTQLRAAVRSLRWAAVVFLMVLTVGVILRLTIGFVG